jgi:hypothetical protein
MSEIVYAQQAELYLASAADINDAIGASFGALGLILTEQDLAPSFFDLRSGFAGELFQKAVNYHVRIALVVADPAQYGARFAELAYEHQRDAQVRIVPSIAHAEEWLKG